MKLSVLQKCNSEKFLEDSIGIKAEFPKLFLKKNGKLYSSLMPRFFKRFSIDNFSEDKDLVEIARAKVKSIEEEEARRSRINDGTSSSDNNGFNQ